VNEDDPKNGNGRKTLLPEFLPAPRATEAQSPPERVAERARVLLQRFRGLGPAAGAALLTLNCSGYMVVDPLPPPPLACSSSPDPFASITAIGSWAEGTATPPSAVLALRAGRYPPGNLVGFGIAAVRVTGGTLLSTEDMTAEVGGTLFHITIAPASATATILVDVDFTCSSQSRTRHFSIAYHVPTDAGDILVVTDAGTD
jgi:hypothetical protein